MNPETPYRRPDRVAQQILEIIGEISTRNINLKNFGFITFTKVQVTSDLKLAKVFYSVIEPKTEISAVTDHLNHMAGAFRKYLGPALKIKYTPELLFIHDESLEYAQKINQLFEDIHARDEADDS
ncbi:MAG: 30S ribosome-binding factor RbfA [Candidatus Neomarinimicrobiota bacterium]